jgi:lipase
MWRAAAVPTDGGQLRVGVAEPVQVAALGTQAPVLLAVHGITATQMAWRPVGEQLPEYRLLAPDLRGRGRSADLPGPYGMARHADDLARTLDALGVDRAVVAGHSMGGFAALVFAHRHADRVRRLLLVDGGVPLPVPAGVSTQQMIEALLGPALSRLAMAYPDRAAYRAFWQAHPAFAEDWNADVEAYVDYDLVGVEPELRSSVRLAAVEQDAVDEIEGPALRAAVAAAADCPLALLRAPLGLQGEPPGLYPEPLLASYAGQLPGLRWATVPAVNHYTILLSRPGARAVAGAIRDFDGHAG